MNGTKKLLKGSVAGIAMLPLLAGGFAAQADTLGDAMAIAYSSNPTLQAARANLRAVDEGVSQARGGWRPQVEIDASTTINQRRSDNVNLDETETTHLGQLTITQNIYAGGGTVADIERAGANVIAQRERLRATEQNVLLNVATAYMDVFRDMAVLDLNRQNVERLRRQLEATNDRFQVGEVTRTDVAQAESRVANAVAEVISAEGTLEISRATYFQIVGKEAEEISEPAFALTLPGSLGEAVDVAVETHPTLRAAQEDLRVANKNVDVAFANLLPTVDLVGTAATSREVTGLDEETNSLQVVAQVNIPLYQRGIVSSQIREAKQRVSQADHTIEEARRAVVEDVTSAWETLQTSAARINSINEEVRATSLALEGVEQEASVGARTVLDVLDAEQELLNAQVSLVRSQRDETVARFSLLSAIGGLSARDLGLDVPVYNAESYLNNVSGKWWGIDTE